MKYLSIMLLILSGCAFNEKAVKNGDCLLYNNKIYKVVEEGSISLKLQNPKHDIYLTTRLFAEKEFDKVDCFDFFSRRSQ